MRVRTGFATMLAVLGLITCSAGLASADVRSPTVLITGSSRGIGFELAKQYAERGWGVIATCRTPAKADQLKAVAAEFPNLVIEELDVTDFDEIDGLAEKYRDVPIDILINNAGILGGNERQKFGTFDYASFDEVMDVNTKGPIKMVEAFVDNVAASDQKKIMNISSAVGSITLTFPGQFFYRSSKAALNMSMRTIAKELRYDKAYPERREIIVGLIDPGVVATDFAKNVPVKMLEPDVSAAAVITVIDEYYQTRRQSGDFINYDGKKMPW